MKRFLIFLVMIFFVGGCATMSQVDYKVFNDQIYTYDGEYDPAEFFEWEFMERTFIDDDVIPLVLVWFINPDKESDVKLVELAHGVYADGSYKLIGYRYFIDNDEHWFFLNPETNNYDMTIHYYKAGGI